MNACTDKCKYVLQMRFSKFWIFDLLNFSDPQHATATDEAPSILNIN